MMPRKLPKRSPSLSARIHATAASTDDPRVAQALATATTAAGHNRGADAAAAAPPPQPAAPAPQQQQQQQQQQQVGTDGAPLPQPAAPVRRSVHQKPVEARTKTDVEAMPTVKPSEKHTKGLWKECEDCGLCFNSNTRNTRSNTSNGPLSAWRRHQLACPAVPDGKVEWTAADHGVGNFPCRIAFHFCHASSSHTGNRNLHEASCAYNHKCLLQKQYFFDDSDAAGTGKAVPDALRFRTWTEKSKKEFEGQLENWYNDLPVENRPAARPEYQSLEAFLNFFCRPRAGPSRVAYYANHPETKKKIDAAQEKNNNEHFLKELESNNDKYKKMIAMKRGNNIGQTSATSDSAAPAADVPITAIAQRGGRGGRGGRGRGGRGGRGPAAKKRRSASSSSSSSSCVSSTSDDESSPSYASSYSDDDDSDHENDDENEEEEEFEDADDDDDPRFNSAFDFDEYDQSNEEDKEDLTTPLTDEQLSTAIAKLKHERPDFQYFDDEDFIEIVRKRFSRFPFIEFELLLEQRPPTAAEEHAAAAAARVRNVEHFASNLCENVSPERWPRNKYPFVETINPARSFLIDVLASAGAETALHPDTLPGLAILADVSVERRLQRVQEVRASRHPDTQWAAPDVDRMLLCLKYGNLSTSSRCVLEQEIFRMMHTTFGAHPHLRQVMEKLRRRRLQTPCQNFSEMFWRLYWPAYHVDQVLEDNHDHPFLNRDDPVEMETILTYTAQDKFPELQQYRPEIRICAFAAMTAIPSLRHLLYDYQAILMVCETLSFYLQRLVLDKDPNFSEANYRNLRGPGAKLQASVDVYINLPDDEKNERWDTYEEAEADPAYGLPSHKEVLDTLYWEPDVDEGTEVWYSPAAFHREVEVHINRDEYQNLPQYQEEHPPEAPRINDPEYHKKIRNTVYASLLDTRSNFLKKAIDYVIDHNARVAPEERFRPMYSSKTSLSTREELAELHLREDERYSSTFQRQAAWDKKHPYARPPVPKRDPKEVEEMRRNRPPPVLRLPPSSSSSSSATANNNADSAASSAAAADAVSSSSFSSISHQQQQQPQASQKATMRPLAFFERMDPQLDSREWKRNFGRAHLAGLPGFCSSRPLVPHHLPRRMPRDEDGEVQGPKPRVVERPFVVVPNDNVTHPTLGHRMRPQPGQPKFITTREVEPLHDVYTIPSTDPRTSFGKRARLAQVTCPRDELPMTDKQRDTIGRWNRANSATKHDSSPHIFWKMQKWRAKKTFPDVAEKACWSFIKRLDATFDNPDQNCFFATLDERRERIPDDNKPWVKCELLLELLEDELDRQDDSDSSDSDAVDEDIEPVASEEDLPKCPCRRAEARWNNQCTLTRVCRYFREHHLPILMEQLEQQDQQDHDDADTAIKSEFRPPVVSAAAAAASEAAGNLSRMTVSLFGPPSEAAANIRRFYMIGWPGYKEPPFFDIMELARNWPSSEQQQQQQRNNRNDDGDDDG